MACKIEILKLNFSNKRSECANFDRDVFTTTIIGENEFNSKRFEDIPEELNIFSSDEFTSIELSKRSKGERFFLTSLDPENKRLFSEIPEGEYVEIRGELNKGIKIKNLRKDMSVIMGFPVTGSKEYSESVSLSTMTIYVRHISPPIRRVEDRSII